MDSLPTDPGSPAPVRLVVTDEPRPAVWLGPGGAEVDILPAVERVLIDVQAGGVYATITLRVDLDFAFPVNRVDVSDRGNVLDGLEAKELDAVIASAGLSESLGSAVLRHIRDRARTRP